MLWGVFMNIEREWSDIQKEILKDICEIDFFIPMTTICLFVRKSERQVYWMIKKMGLKRVISIWSKSDDEYLRQNYSNKDISIRTMRIKLGMSENSIHIRASKLKLKRGLSKLDRYLIKNYKKIDTKDIADKFKVSMAYVYKRAFQLGLSKPHEYDDITTLRYNEIVKRYSNCSTMRLSVELDVSTHTVKRIASKEKIKKTKSKKSQRRKIKNSWSKEQERFLLINHDKMTMNQMASRLFLSISSVRGKLRHMGLKDRYLRIYRRGNIKFTYITEEEKIKKLEYARMYIDLLNENGKGDHYVKVSKAS